MTRLPKCNMLTVIGMHVSVVCAVRVGLHGVFRTHGSHAWVRCSDMVGAAVMFELWGVQAEIFKPNELLCILDVLKTMLRST